MTFSIASSRPEVNRCDYIIASFIFESIENLEVISMVQTKGVKELTSLVLV